MNTFVCKCGNKYEVPDVTVSDVKSFFGFLSGASCPKCGRGPKAEIAIGDENVLDITNGISIQ